MKQVLGLMEDVLRNGRDKSDRTGVGTRSVFGRQMRFAMSDGFPLMTTKLVTARWIFEELRMFLMGETNNNFLRDKGITIWDEWALKYDDIAFTGNINTDKYLIDTGRRLSFSDVGAGSVIDKREFDSFVNGCNLEGIDYTEYLTHRPGDLGPIYGAVWRDFGGVDQIKWAIRQLRDHPMSRRIIVSAWDPKRLPREDLTPEENVMEGKQALAPCHTFFQFNAVELTLQERHVQFQLVVGRGNCYKDNMTHSDYDAVNIPRYGLSLQLYQRSADVCLGVPYNIASYAFLLHIVAHMTGMVPMDFVHAFGDVHIYSNHFDNAQVQMNRTPGALPKLVIKCDPKLDPSEYQWSDFEIVDYKHQGKIEYEVAK